MKKSKKVVLYLIILTAILFGTGIFFIESKQIFKNNKDTIEYSSAYKAWLNLSDEDKKNTIAPSKYQNSYTGTTSLYSNSINSELPSYYNLRDISTDISPIKDQKSSGLCWSFASHGILEYYLGVNNILNNDKYYNLNPVHITYALGYRFSDYINPYGIKEVNSGGNMFHALKYWTSGIGPLDSNQEMEEKFLSNPSSESILKASEVLGDSPKIKVEDIIQIPTVKITYDSNNEITDTSFNSLKDTRLFMKESIIKNGSITFGSAAPLIAGNKIKINGNEITCSSINGIDNSGNITAYPREQTDHLCGAHEMQIIGWDDNYSKENFKYYPNNDKTKDPIIPKEDGAWIVQNSTVGEQDLSYFTERNKKNTQILEKLNKTSDEEWDPKDNDLLYMFTFQKFNSAEKFIAKSISGDIIINGLTKSINELADICKSNSPEINVDSNIYSMNECSEISENSSLKETLLAVFTYIYNYNQNDENTNKISINITDGKIGSNVIGSIYYYSYESYMSDLYSIKKATLKDYDNIYQYNPTGDFEYINATGAGIVFDKEDEDELLKEVSVYIINPSSITDFSKNIIGYKLYVNNVDGDLESENLKLVKEETNAFLFTGYYTIKLDEPIRLTGDKFAIKIETTNGKVYFYNNKSKLSKEEVGIVKGHSYIYQSNKKTDGYDYKVTHYYQGGYQETIDGVSASIKAFTTKENHDETEKIKTVLKYDESKTLLGQKITIKHITDNIKSSSIFDYKVIDSDDNDVTDNFAINKNIIINNLGLSTITIDENTKSDIYYIKTYFNDKLASTNTLNLTDKEITIDSYSKSKEIIYTGEEETITLNLKTKNITSDDLKVNIFSDGNDKTSDFKVNIETLENDIIKVTINTTKDTKPGNYNIVAKDQVKVEKDFEIKDYTHVEKIELDKSNIKIVKGSQETLIATITPEDAKNKNVSWESSNDDIVKVDQDGKITAVDLGTATITVTTDDGGHKANCEVEVVEKSSYNIVGNMIKGIKPESDVSNFNLGLSSNHVVKIYDSKDNLKSDGIFVTGDKVKVYENDELNQEYVVIIAGDTTGDGKITISDVSKLYQYLKKKITIEDYFIEAGNVVNTDNEIKIGDVAKLYQYIKKKITDLEV